MAYITIVWKIVFLLLFTYQYWPVSYICCTYF